MQRGRADLLPNALEVPVKELSQGGGGSPSTVPLWRNLLHQKRKLFAWSGDEMLG